MTKEINGRYFLDYFFLFLKGIAMGAANKVPGVSGGIVALVGGFYEELIFSLQHFNFKAIKLFFSGRFYTFWKYINGTFLLSLFSGIIVSFFSVSLLLDFGLEFYEPEVLGLFLGMIITSFYYIREEVEKWTPATYVSLFLGALFGFFITYIHPGRENDHLWFVFFCGLISVSGMTLPGLSGSFLLLILGNYNLLLVETITNLYNTLLEIIQGNMSFLGNSQQIRLLKIMAVFSLGSIAGLVFFANLLSYVLKQYHNFTIAVIMGFILGSVRIVWPWRIDVYKTDLSGTLLYNKIGNPIIINQKFYWPQPLNDSLLSVILSLLLGVLLIIGLEHYGKKRNK